MCALKVEAQTEFRFARRADREHAGAAADTHRVGTCVGASDRAVDGAVSTTQAAESAEVREIKKVEERNAGRNGQPFANLEGPRQNGVDIFVPAVSGVVGGRQLNRWNDRTQTDQLTLSDQTGCDQGFA